MRVLFDHCIPDRLKTDFVGQDITTARSLGWDTLSNGEWLKATEREGYDVFLTVDKDYETEHSIQSLNLAVIIVRVHPCTIKELRSLVPLIQDALSTAKPGVRQVVRP